MANETAQPISENDTITVTELVKVFQSVLVAKVPFIRVTGEISELNRPNSGHIYLTIADNSSSFPVVMWRGSAQGLSANIKPGLAVVVEGRPAIYNVNGKLQLVASRILPVGEGLLQQKFLELKHKLESEGLFSAARKRPLPFFPRGIGIVTSASGAAIHDIMTRLNDRLPSVCKYLIDVRVQGPGAADEIASAIRRFNKLMICDVLIVGRGGGSLEDLWAFNEEVVVRAIFRSELPVISAVGHEVDVTLSDLVADMRAPTPTAAAEMVVPKALDLLVTIDGLVKRLSGIGDRVGLAGQRVDEIFRRLRACFGMDSQRRRFSLTSLESKLKLVNPRTLISNYKLKLSALNGRLLKVGGDVLIADQTSLERLVPQLSRATQAKVMMSRLSITALEHRLTAVHPARTLERGYAIARSSGKVLTDIDSIAKGRELEITLANGVVFAEVIRTKKD